MVVFLLRLLGETIHDNRSRLSVSRDADGIAILCASELGSGREFLGWHVEWEPGQDKAVAHLRFNYGREGRQLHGIGCSVRYQIYQNDP